MRNLNEMLLAPEVAVADLQKDYAKQFEKQELERWLKEARTQRFFEDLRIFQTEFEKAAKMAALRGEDRVSVNNTLQAAVVERIRNYVISCKFEFSE